MPVKRIIKRIMDFLTSRLERKLILIFFSVLLAVGIPAALIELRNAEREVYQLNERR